MNPSLRRRCIAEAIITYVLVLIGCGAMVVEADTHALSHAGVALTWGLVVMAMIYATGDLSGAHMNPAVSIALVVRGRFRAREAAVYVVAQCIGATLAGLSLRAALPLNEAMLGATVISIAAPAAWAVEFMMTAILMWVVMGVSSGPTDKSQIAGLAIGATIAMEAMVAGPLTRASMNPARSLGPAIAAALPGELWIYLTAPVAGAIVGGWLFDCLRASDTQAEPSADAIENETD
ncbi:MAG: aquaporin [Planctomycetota bacterium]